MLCAALLLVFGCDSTSEEESPGISVGTTGVTTTGGDNDFVAGDGIRNTNGDGVFGGSMYDSIWLTLEIFNIPTWARGDADEEGAHLLAYRCMSCHGWDYRGSEGTYGPNFLNVPWVANINLIESRHKPAAELKAAILSPPHPPEYAEIFQEIDLEDFAAFIKNEMVDTSVIYSYYPEKGHFAINPGGNQERGHEFIEANCVTCHGPETDQIKTNQGRFSLGSASRIKFFETIHKILFGSPQTSMRPIKATPQELFDVMAALCDFEKYPSIYFEDVDAETLAREDAAQVRTCINY